MSRLVILMLLFALVGCAPGLDDPQSSAVKILVLGDSNTDSFFTTMYGEGRSWPDTLQSLLAEADPATIYEIANEATAGDFSSDVAREIAAHLEAEPDIVFCMIGTNDVSGEHAPTAPWHTIAQTEANVRTTIEAVQDAGATMVLMQPPPAVSKTVHDAGQTTMPFWRSRTRQEAANSLQQISELYSSLADEYGIGLVATWDKTAKLGFDGSQTSSTVQRQYVYDGVHITENQQGNIAQWAFEALPSMRKDN